MKIDLDIAKIGTCDNCHKEKVWIRRIKSQGAGFGDGPRGYFDICFDCVSPICYFSNNRGSFESPLNWSKEKVTKYLEDKRGMKE